MSCYNYQSFQMLQCFYVKLPSVFVWNCLTIGCFVSEGPSHFSLTHLYSLRNFEITIIYMHSSYIVCIFFFSKSTCLIHDSDRIFLRRRVLNRIQMMLIHSRFLIGYRVIMLVVLCRSIAFQIHYLFIFIYERRSNKIQNK